jgi:hypothetical protein
MSNVRRLGDRMTIPIPQDEAGFTGRECPVEECEGYFKIEFGTGLKGEGLPCRCPYCGHQAPHNQFFTKAQVAYAQSVAVKAITDAIRADLKKMEFDHKPKGFGIGISMKLKPGRATPIHYYREEKLETEVVCTICTLRYAVYGVFAFCPDCGQHNSGQILERNLELVAKMLALSEGLDVSLSSSLVENALEDCVSSFDGFGRELCRVHAACASDPARAERMSFQNLETASQNIKDLFAVDLVGSLDADEWVTATRGFQKRHLLAHAMGVIDQDYIRRSHDTNAVLGRKVSVDAVEVGELARIVAKTARFMIARIGAPRP